MSISISSSNGNSVGSANTTRQHNSVVDSLERRKTELQNDLKEVNASKLDSKTKAAKVKEINEQIAAIEQQIQQAKVQEQQEKMQEAMAKSAEKEAEKQKEQGQDSGGVVLAASLSQMVYASGQNSNLKTLSQVRTKLKGEINVANSQMKNSATGASNTYQMAAISDASGQIAQVEQKMATAVKNTLKMQRAVQKGQEKAAEKAGSDVTKTQEAENKTDETAVVNEPAVQGAQEDQDKDKQQRKSVDITV